jgi:hypothetical protein
MTFSDWWIEYWTRKLTPEIINAAFEEVAKKSWDASVIESKFLGFEQWWNRFWTKPFKVHALNLAFREVAEKAWEAAKSDPIY